MMSGRHLYGNEIMYAFAAMATAGSMLEVFTFAGGL